MTILGLEFVGGFGGVVAVLQAIAPKQVKLVIRECLKKLILEVLNKWENILMTSRVYDNDNHYYKLERIKSLCGNMKMITIIKNTQADRCGQF